MHSGLRAIAAASLCAAVAVPVPAQRPAPAASGLAFAVTFSEGGRAVSGDRFALRVAGEKKPLRMVLDGIDLSGGSFRARVLLKNETGSELLAVRLDFVSATEVLKSPVGGQETSRAISTAAARPLEWRTIAGGAEADPQTLDAGPLGFGPDTQLVIVMGAVSGIARGPTLDFAEAGPLSALETDAAGNVYATGSGGKIYRTGPDGGPAVEVRQIPPREKPAPEPACAPHLAAGRLCRVAPDGAVWVVNGPDASVLEPASGATIRSFRPLGDQAPSFFVLGREGRFYVGVRNGTVRGLRAF